jgi:hypothetical protein
MDEESYVAAMNRLYRRAGLHTAVRKREEMQKTTPNEFRQIIGAKAVRGQKITMDELKRRLVAKKAKRGG